MNTTSKQKTPAKIRAAFEKLLATTAINDITVTELCQAANINRATFYYHYNSVSDVYKEIEKNMEDDFKRFMELSTVTDNGSPEKSFYVTFFEFVARNANICRFLINSPCTSKTFLADALEAGHQKVLNDLAELYHDCSKTKIGYYYLFVSSGFLGLLSYWLNGGMKETPEEIAAIGESVSQSGIKYLA
ncbi:MAG: TetR/AcrR family transcriptional regulator C-terminal domain-containing protein [Clostridiales bacterium]|nr:TetR/AcrR family transcriptional regulator C-terminal domain-containing protein [Clostridiales bacterium]